ncbi:MAG TPA: Rne/Rng family ribonuclease, partial [Terriglobales bacterium]|nr:Rne/Rng family ribonuclease [Terriglobales bacterium]
MSKELFVSSTPHETKVAVVEDDQLSEIYFERENEYTLAGSIYKGRVTRVLPGMQSAFVDLGLERDAFLYVTDFFEEQEDREEYEQLVTQAHEDATRAQPQPPLQPQQPQREPAAPPQRPVETAREAGEAPPAAQLPRRGSQEAAPEGARNGDVPRRWRGRRRRGGRDFPEPKFARPQEPAGGPPPGYQPIILPGESISKYQRMAQPAEQAPRSTHAVEPTAAEPGEAASLAASTEPFAVTLEREIEQESRQPASPSELPQPAATTQSEFAPAAVPSAASNPGRPFAPGPGVIEEEEIEEEEGELPPFGDEFEDAEYEDLVEETLHRDQPAAAEVSPENGAALLEATEEVAVERAAIEGEVEELAEGEGEEREEEEGDGLEEAEAEVMAEGQEQQGEEARAEVRAPAATAGYQQRAERSEEFRRGRGRRGGRRMRTRRNIQRGPAPKITDLLREGQEILVQIAKEPIGKKGARITSHIALPGRFLVYMPTVNHIGVSRKISSDEERQRLKRLILSEHQGTGGFIVRTAAEGTSDDDLRADIRFLLNLWTEIRNRAESSKAPALIYHDLNLVERILRDQVTQSFNAVWVDSEPEYERVLRFVSRFAPNLVKRVKLYTKDAPLFETFNIQEEINKALKSKVWLKSGGYIVINQTEALVAIDINTGKYVGKTTRLEDTIVKTNIDAIKEIVRQIRLRDLGGIIVIDFI